MLLELRVLGSIRCKLRSEFIVEAGGQHREFELDERTQARGIFRGEPLQPRAERIEVRALDVATGQSLANQPANPFALCEADSV